MNEICRKCEHGSNLVNGRYCIKHNHYVEHSVRPSCEINNSKTEENGKGNNRD